MDLFESAKGRIDDLRRLQEAGLVCLEGDFFPSVHYPPITMYPKTTEEDLFEGYHLPADGLFDLYAHIPFCLSQCLFCHYPVRVGASPDEKDRYLDALEREMDIYLHRLGLRVFKARSILVAGGTPTHLAPRQLERFLEAFCSRIDFSCCTQFSYDLDPATLLGLEGLERLRILKAYGVDRLTIGVQATEDRILEPLNRPHTVDEAVDAIRRCQAHGFKVNIEFIYGLPGQTLKGWAAGMEWAVSLATEEIQLYRLKVQPYGDRNGSVTRMFRRSPQAFPSVEQTLMMKQVAAIVLARHGYRENLGRVFTKRREDFSHYADNQCCRLLDQVGFGVTAFSSLRDRFGLNTPDFEAYYSLLGQGKLPLDRGLVRGKEDQLRWALILPLKNRRVYKKHYQKVTGVSIDRVFRDKIERLKDFGVLQEDDQVLELTDKGRFFADEVCQQFYRSRYLPFPESAYAGGCLNPYKS